MLAVYIVTKNDTNGNPRRGWIVYNAAGPHKGVAHDFVDEGYAGAGALREKYPRAVTTDRIQVTSTEYNSWKRTKF